MHRLIAVAMLGAARAGCVAEAPPALFVPAPGSPIPVAGGPQNVAVGDVNNDDNDVAVMLGDGRGGFVRAAASPFPVGPSPYPLAVGDVNGDGKPDVITPNSKPKDWTVTVLLGDGGGGFRPAPGSPFAAAGQ